MFLILLSATINYFKILFYYCFRHFGGTNIELIYHRRLFSNPQPQALTKGFQVDLNVHLNKYKQTNKITSPIILPNELTELISEFNRAFHDQWVEFEHRLYLVFYVRLLQVVACVVQLRCTDVACGTLQSMSVKFNLVPVLVLHLL